MLNKIKELTNNKRVLILGFGKEGQSTYGVLKQLNQYSQLDVADKFMKNPDIGDEHIFLTGDNYMDSLDTYDIVFKSPGIVLPKKPEQYKCYITSQTDIFLSNYGRQTIGITGTKGKSTVSSLLHHTLNTIGTDCLFAGNIGIPVFDVIDKIRQRTVIVLELSCHQLEYCSHSPAVSVLLNIFEDHLDYYKTFENYAKTKVNIYKYQFALDTLFCNPSYMPNQTDCISRVVAVSMSDLPFSQLELIDGIKLRGDHNLLNCSFVYNICKLFDISENDFIIALQSYQPLPHRLEFIGKKCGVDYFDDSISTTVESTISAIKSINNTNVLLIGGMDRGIDYTELVDFLSQSSISYIILMYESGKRIYDMLIDKDLDATLNSPRFIHVEDLYQATEKALKYAKPGTACLLSPASASYGEFKNFEERGNLFKELIFFKKGRIIGYNE